MHGSRNDWINRDVEGLMARPWIYEVGAVLGLTASWLVAFCWYALAVVMAEAMAHGIASLPQAGQPAWVAFYQVLPAVPILGGVAFGVGFGAITRQWLAGGAVAAGAVTAASWAVLVIPIPAPP